MNLIFFPTLESYAFSVPYCLVIMKMSTLVNFAAWKEFSSTQPSIIVFSNSPTTYSMPFILKDVMAGGQDI